MFISTTNSRLNYAIIIIIKVSNFWTRQNQIMTNPRIKAHNEQLSAQFVCPESGFGCGFGSRPTPPFNNHLAHTFPIKYFQKIRELTPPSTVGGN